jgi:hypothetical protein
MQHGRKQELVLDILENAIAVLRREREVHGRPVGDVIINLETASVVIQRLQEERSPFDTLHEDPFEGPVVNGEQFAPGYTPEAAAYEQATRDLRVTEAEKAEAAMVLAVAEDARCDRSMQERHPIDREAARKGFTE